jgi:hypothetical protein
MHAGVTAMGQVWRRNEAETVAPGVNHQRRVVLHQEVVELQVYLRQLNRDAEQVGGYFIDARHE